MAAHDQYEQPTLPGLEMSPIASVVAVSGTVATEAVVYRVPADEIPGATDRWLEEVGGGGRRVSLAVDPPRLPTPRQAHPTPHYSHRGGRAYPERSGRDVALELDNAQRAAGPTAHSTPPPVAYTAAKMLLAHRAAARLADGDPVMQLALLRKHTEDTLRRAS